MQEATASFQLGGEEELKKHGDASSDDSSNDLWLILPLGRVLDLVQYVEDLCMCMLSPRPLPLVSDK